VAVRVDETSPDPCGPGFCFCGSIFEGIIFWIRKKRKKFHIDSVAQSNQNRSHLVVPPASSYRDLELTSKSLF
jgi:hypothetical protein